MSAAWFLAWLAGAVPEPVFFAVLFGVPAVVIGWDYWRHRTAK
jgi:hypothetical protein